MITQFRPIPIATTENADPVLLSGALRLLCALRGYRSLFYRKARKGRAKERNGITYLTRHLTFHPSAFTLFALLLPALIGVAQVNAQTPSPTPTAVSSPKPAPEPITLGTIRGRVVSSDGRPLTNASVMAQGVSATPSIKIKPVDAEGAFVLEELPAGLYIVMATVPGYIDETMTTGDPAQLPRHLIGARLKITMIKGGVITGAVTDSKGQPVVGVPVQASPPGGAAALSSFMGGTSSETDDRGVYRIFGLPPGQYTVAAGGGSAFGQFSTTGFELDVPTYYPSATRDTAVPVAVRSGDEATGIDIKYRGTEGHTINGVVTGTVETGAAGGAVFVILSNAGSSSILSMALATALEQRRVFSFSGVADGEYDLFAGFQGAPTDNSLVATKRVTVRNGDLTGVELKLAQLGSIAGTLTLDPIKDENKCDQRGSQVNEILVNAPRDDAKKTDRSLMPSLFGNIGTMLDAKGEFVIRNVEPGKYRFALKLPSEAWYVRAITPAGASVASPVLPSSAPASARTSAASPTPASPPTSPSAQTPPPGVSQSELSQGLVTIKANERVGGMTVSIGQDAAGLAGKVETAGPVPGGLRVHLVPAEREQANNVLRYSESIVNSDATFAFNNIEPGRYLIVTRVKPETAATVRQRDVAWDAAARARLRTGAEAANTVVELKPCQRLADYSLKLQPIP
ncbi:MAG: carboxypeptidase regulatory-like domain-containing protein [Pyrinomonadaceae bacterium]|nr:carboxypeptidase regulatory-like domain-containing protein [Pyrinomonadaceae bacterium]